EIRQVHNRDDAGGAARPPAVVPYRHRGDRRRKHRQRHDRQHPLAEPILARGHRRGRRRFVQPPPRHWRRDRRRRIVLGLQSRSVLDGFVLVGSSVVVFVNLVGGNRLGFRLRLGGGGFFFDDVDVDDLRFGRRGLHDDGWLVVLVKLVLVVFVDGLPIRVAVVPGGGTALLEA